MEQLAIRLFRSFLIEYNGREILQSLQKSPKSIAVLKYLILNKDKAVPVRDLIELFWDEESGQNPENALKTLISRMRKAFSNEDPKLRDCIVTEQRTYHWKPPMLCEIDIFSFEALCTELINARTLPVNEMTRNKFERVLDLYKGDIDGDEWIKSRSLYYHNLYLKTVQLYIESLKAAGDYDAVISITRRALDIDPFDEPLNLEHMYALKETSRNNEALVHYRHSTDMYYKYLGIDPSEKMLEFYKQLIKTDLEARENLSVIRERLLLDDNNDRAFVCDYSIFRDIYQLQLRNAERWDVLMYLALVMLENLQDKEFDPFVLDRMMRGLLDILIKCLRKGDIITRYSSSQYAILLQMTSDKDGEVVIDRIKRLFFETGMEPYAKIHFQIGPIAPDYELGK